ncbi:BURP domain containing protein [Parasponia andersonii]|uniref:BURP domain containing protein n=1 Tax=Parasponia andersonii TaxID=3476 RepID=A0A2P5BGJ4_PARAD|nr:BURP domain containing protein [Parasponia andersonii]
MDFRVNSWCLLLFVFLVLPSTARSSEPRQLVDHEKLHSRQDNIGSTYRLHNHIHIAHYDDPSSDIDPSILQSSVVFNLKDMKIGKKLVIYFPKKDSSTPYFLPRDQADSIPFSLKQLPYILSLFSYAHGSPQARAVEETLRSCETVRDNEETKVCTTSLESMLDFASRVFGISEDDDDHPTLLTTTFLTDQKSSFQNFTVLETPKEILTPKMIGCHLQSYPYTVFYCHTQKGGNKVYKISLAGDNGDKVDAVAVCHLDTSEWNPNQVAFHALGVKLGDPVCHFFPPHGNLVWVHTPTASSS